MKRPSRSDSEVVRKPGSGRAGFDHPVTTAFQRLSQNGIEKDSGSIGADRELDPPAPTFRADIETAAAHQCVPGDHRQVEQ